MSMQRNFGEHHDAIMALHRILTSTWAEKDPTSEVAKYPASYSETFLDMARAAIGAGYVPAAARIASLEAERDAASESATSMTRWGAEQRDRADAAEAERDGLAPIIAKTKQWRHDWLEPDKSESYPHKPRVHVRNLSAILAQSPADALAAVKAKAWDSCLDAIEENELNTIQAREGNPYRALVGHGTPEPTDEWARTAAVLNDLPDAVRRERLARGDSLRAAARASGVHFSVLDRFERRATNGNIATVRALLLWLASKPHDPTTEPTGENEHA